VNALTDLSAFRHHGGRLDAAEALFPSSPRPWLDLSTGVNPRPYPVRALSRQGLTRLPAPESLAALEAAAATAFGVAPDRVAATPGTEAALRLLPRLLGARSVAITQPTYGGHAAAWRAAGAEIRPSESTAEARVVVNPNNPDGRITSADALVASAEAAWTIVDEAFADPSPEMSVAPQAGGRLIVLRSFGKFYGLPGLRLGFVLGEPSLATEVRDAFGDWPVSSAAIDVGCAAYADEGWRRRARERLRRDRMRLDRLLEDGGLQVLGGTDLFRLARAEDAEAVFLRLARAGVLCRPFKDPNLLRFGLPSAAADWARLGAALSKGRP
jgi:cobalamin biosynthesis protein CobC